MHPNHDASKTREPSRRMPALLVAVAVAIGIAADRRLDAEWSMWLLMSAAFIGGWLALIVLRRDRTAAVLLLLACVAAGGSRHHQFWSVGDVEDLSQYASTDRSLVRLRGIVSEQPSIRKADLADWRTAIPQIDQSLCIVRAIRLESSTAEIPVSGKVRLTVNGHLLHVAVGDEIEMVGWLSLPRSPGNPGQFDFRDYLRRQRCRSLMFVNHPAAVKRLKESRPHPRRLLAGFRQEAETLCVSHLSQENLPLATALLLGDRARMTDDIRETFAQSGTAHVLAISGLHVGILAAVLWICCRLFNASPGMTAGIIITAVVLYAVISGGRPPVARATVFVLIAVGGFLLKRPAVALNTLALAAIAVLAWNPSDLFDVGTQLSFLAVTGIVLAQQWSPLEQSDRERTIESEGAFRSQTRSLGRWLLRGYGMMCGIWLLTVPLTAARFHLISPIGFLINVLLIPYVCLLLWSGFAFLILGWLVPLVAVPLGILFDTLLSGLLGLVRFFSDLQLGHLHAPGPSDAWIVVYYLLVAVFTIALLRGWQTRWVVQTLLVWTIAGLVIGFGSQQRDGLRCTFLDMGHGCSVLLKMPNGRTLLYDAGSLTDASRAQQTVENALWARGIDRLDVVIASHADVDHFNGLHGLLETVPVGSVMMSQSFLDFEQRSVRELCDVVERKRLPIRLLQAEDRLLLDENVTVTVLHPPGYERFDDDNENSVTLQVEYAGRRILLTGDLEKRGMLRLLSTARTNVDVMLSPHHGSRKANPPELADWAGPRWVVVGTQEERRLQYLRETYGEETRVVTTGEYGAVTFEILNDGVINASSGRQPLDPERGELSRR